MLEILDLLVSSNKPLSNNIVFLFNGAEENLLPVSYKASTNQQLEAPETKRESSRVVSWMPSTLKSKSCERMAWATVRRKAPSKPLRFSVMWQETTRKCVRKKCEKVFGRLTDEKDE